MRVDIFGRLLACIPLFCIPAIGHAGQIRHPNPDGLISVISDDFNGEDFSVYKGLEVTENGTLTNNTDSKLSNTSSPMNNRGTLYNNGRLNNQYSATFTNSGALNNAGVLQNHDNSTLNNSGILNSSGDLTSWSTLINSGLLLSSGTWTSNGSLTNSGTINASGDTHNGGALINNGTLTTSRRLWNAGSLTNNNTLTIAGGLLVNYAPLINSGTLTNNAGGRLNNGVGITLDNRGTLTNQGSVENGGVLTNSGIVNNSGSMVSYATVTNSGTWNNSGTLSGNGWGNFLQTAGQTTVNGKFAQSSIKIDGGSLSGTGSITGNVVIGSAGSVELGLSPGTLTINGDFSSSGNLLFNLSGADAGANDLLTITGKGSFSGGSVQFNFLNGFQPVAGNTWKFLSAKTTTGWESLSLTVNGLDAGLGWKLADTGSGMGLSITAAVPEPETYAMLMAGLGLIGGIARGRKSR